MRRVGGIMRWLDESRTPVAPDGSGKRAGERETSETDSGET